MNKNVDRMRYALITPARNEENLIERTIQSVVSQTVPPTKWVIVNDGSTDATGEIIAKYVGRYEWMEVVNLPTHRDRSFAGKVHAFNAGFDRLKGIDLEVVGNLDADVSFDPEYLGFLLKKFEEDSTLGVAGTIFLEEGYNSGSDSFEGQNHVAGGCQLFRWRCFQEIGGYVPNRAGGIDWIAVTTARMKGWKTRSFREKSFFHYRSLGTAERSVLGSMFSYGEKDYYLGNHPIWELFRVAYRSMKKPYVLGAMALCAGYLSAFARRMKRPVSKELMEFHRGEEMASLRAIFAAVLTFKGLDTFRLKTSGHSAMQRQ
jgi:glycosyltransferase involved in cell wall biosynthesis